MIIESNRRESRTAAKCARVASGILLSGLGIVCFASFMSACATGSSAQKSAYEGIENAEGKASEMKGAAEEGSNAATDSAQGYGDSASEMAENAGGDWKGKLLDGTASATGCAREEVKIDDWQEAMKGSFGASCGDKSYRCTKSDGGVSCDPK